MEDRMLLWLGAILIVLSVSGYIYRAAIGAGTGSHLRKEQRQAIRKKRGLLMWISTVSLLLGMVAAGVDMINYSSSKYSVDKLAAGAEIAVQEDKDYGAGHSTNPVPYEQAIPTSGTHSPHDIEYGFYTSKPQNELLVHNLEHGDIIIHYRPDAPATLTDKLKELVRYRKAGSGILAVPDPAVPEGKELVATAWTKTLELDTYDEARLGTFIQRYINKGPENIQPEVRQDGGTM